MRIETIGLKGFRRDNGEWSWTPDVVMSYEGDEPHLLDHQKKNIEDALEELRVIIQGKVESWTPPKAPGQAAQQTLEAPVCVECKTRTEAKKSSTGSTYFYCPKCKANRRRDGSAFPGGK